VSLKKPSLLREYLCCVALGKLNDTQHSCTYHITWLNNKVRELILQGLFIMNLYQLDRQQSLLFGSTEKAAWKS